MPAKAEIVVRQAYELLDFGDGRKLERFGDYVVDRPSPAAEGFARRDESLWRQADWRFRKTRGETGEWKRRRTDLPAEWTIEWDDRIPPVPPRVFRIRPNPNGNVGLFPEAYAAWHLAEGELIGTPRRRMLNLFAYTGGATLAVARYGAEVVHVDSSSASVAVARENAALSGLAETPIRWIVEDARKFVKRELRRERSYDLVLLDPPTWGHGPKGQAWKFEEDVDELLDDSASLVRPTKGTLVFTGHAPGWDAGRARRHLLERTSCGRAIGRELTIRASDGRELPAGWLAAAFFADRDDA